MQPNTVSKLPDVEENNETYHTVSGFWVLSLTAIAEKIAFVKKIFIKDLTSHQRFLGAVNLSVLPSHNFLK